MNETVGLVGVGAMGSALLDRLHKAQKTVQAYDISKDALAAATDAGARAVGSPAEASLGAARVHIFVRTDEEVLTTTLSSGGVLSSAGPGTVIFLHSTILPKTTLRVAEAAAKGGVDVLDVPITSVPSRVRAGHGAMLIGGSESVVSGVREYLQLLASGIYHMGPLGCGNVAKLAKNAINSVERIIFSEMLRLAIAGGLEPRRFLDMLSAEHHGSVVTEWQKAVAITVTGPAMRPVTNLLNKDLPMAAELATELALNLPVTHQAAAEGLILLRRWSKDWSRLEMD